MKRLAQWAWPLARLTLGLALVSWLLSRVWSDPRSLDTASWPSLWPLWLLGGHLLLLGAYLVGIARWRLLMHAHHIPLSWPRSFTLFFIGHFFNAFMLGSTGGDMVKAYYAARETHHRKTEAASLVFIDRLVGLCALLVLVLLVLAFRLPLLFQQPALAREAVFLLALLVTLGLVTALLWSRNWIDSPIWNRHATSGRAWSFAFTHLGRVYGALYHFKERPAVLGGAFALSLAVHALSLLGCWMFASAIASGLTFVQAFTLYPILGAAGAIPLTPGGLGFREGAAVFLFGTVGVPPETSVWLSLLPYLSASLWSLFGGLLYLADPIRKKAGPLPAPPS